MMDNLISAKKVIDFIKVNSWEGEPRIRPFETSLVNLPGDPGCRKVFQCKHCSGIMEKMDSQRYEYCPFCGYRILGEMYGFLDV